MTLRQMLFMSLWAGIATCAIAQDQAPRIETPVNDTLEPAVDTSAPAQSEKPAETATAEPAKPAPRGTGRALDRIELDTTQITGNRELPKVLYIVPWKRSDLGDLLGRPVNSLLDEVLEPVDRDVFKRENRYYRALKPDSGSPAPSSAPAQPPVSSE